MRGGGISVSSVRIFRLTNRYKLLHFSAVNSPRLLEAGREAAIVRLLLFMAKSVSPRTYVYIDAFNLYYGAVKNTPHKWLDLAALCRLLLPRHDVQRIKYFTARVSGAVDPEQPIRQATYLRALRTIPNLTITFGHFLSHKVWMPLATPASTGGKWARVVKTEEKGSDVNLAVHLLYDGFQGEYDVAVVISNDSDLVEPIRIVMDELKLPVGVVSPHRKRPSKVLVRQATFFKTIRTPPLSKCQFASELSDKKGEFRKPAAW